MAERRFSFTRFLRSPRLIVGEVGALVLSGILMTLIPQQGAVATEASGTGGPVPAAIPMLGLDRIARTGWFLGLVLLSGASLAVVLSSQVRRARADWSRLPRTEAFRLAPLRTEFLRAAAPPGGSPTTTVRLRGRLGLLGSPLFHFGLVVVALAGIVRMAFGADAQVDLFEGEVLSAGPAGWAAQWPGLLARPFSIAEPARLETVRPYSYPSGALRALDATLTVGSGPLVRKASVSVNTPLEVAGGRLFVTAVHGPAALLALEEEGQEASRKAVLLRFDKGRWQGTLRLSDDTEARLSARDNGTLPDAIEVRLFRGGLLAWVGALRPGEGATTAPGSLLSLAGIRWWLRIGGTRDASLPIAYAGFLFVALGALLIFAVIPIAEAVLVEKTPEGERVTVALLPRRFSPLYFGCFEALARREGAPAH